MVTIEINTHNRRAHCMHLTNWMCVIIQSQFCVTDMNECLISPIKVDVNIVNISKEQTTPPWDGIHVE